MLFSTFFLCKYKISFIYLCMCFSMMINWKYIFLSFDTKKCAIVFFYFDLMLSFYDICVNKLIFIISIRIIYSLIHENNWCDNSDSMNQNGIDYPRHHSADKSLLVVECVRQTILFWWLMNTLNFICTYIYYYVNKYQRKFF